jgi:hypothetical protein
MKIRRLGLLTVASLAACSSPSSDNVETAQRVALCQQIMKKYIVEAKIYERDQQRLVASCQISQKERSLAQWQCVLDAMERGGKYAEASDQCGRSLPSSN